VSEDGIPEGVGSQSAHHSHLQDAHQFTAAGGEYGSAENLSVVGIHDSLDHSPRFTVLGSPGNRGGGHRNHFDIQTFVPRLFFGQPYPAQFRIGEKTIDGDSAGNADVRLFYQVFIDDEVVIIRNMGKLRAALDVAEGINARYVSLQAIIDADKSVWVERDACGGGIQSDGIGLAASGQEDMRGRDGTGRTFVFKTDVNGFSRRDLRRFCTGENFDAVFLEDTPDLRCDVFVFPGEEAAVALHDGDLAAQPSV